MDVGISRPKACFHCPLTKEQSWSDFCVQLTLGTYPGPAWNKEATQNGFGPCGSPFHGNEEWHLLQQLWCNTNRQLSYNEKIQLHLVRRFGTFWGDLLGRALMVELWFPQRPISKAMVYLWRVDRHSYCYKLYLACLLVISKANRFQFISYFKKSTLDKIRNLVPMIWLVISDVWH